jgi:uncharacterized RDD family membrane protein YckC
VSYVPSPAGFWKRFVAYFVDCMLVGAVVNVLVSLALPFASLALPSTDQLLREAQYDPVAALVQLLPIVGWVSLASCALYVVVAAAYFIGMEGSRRQATFGKQWAGIKVTALDGGPPGRARVVGRFVAATLSWLTLNLGHALAAWTREHRALHDYLAGTRVENVDPAKTAMPGWGWFVIGLNVLFLLASAVIVAALALLIANAGGLPLL